MTGFRQVFGGQAAEMPAAPAAVTLVDRLRVLSCGLTDHRARADPDRGDERAVRSDEGAGADLGPVLEDAVVVAGDRPRPDVRPPVTSASPI